MLNVPVEIKRLENFYGSDLPAYETEGAAAFDLRAAEKYFLPAGDTVAIPTGLAVSIPEGFEIQVRSRSGLSSKGIVVANSPGTIDSDYRGEIKILVRNEASRGYQIKKGDRIAQCVLAPAHRARWIEVLELDATARGAGGFGSTGN